MKIRHCVFKITRLLGLHYNHYVSLSVPLSIRLLAVSENAVKFVLFLVFAFFMGWGVLCKENKNLPSKSSGCHFCW